MDRQQTNTRSRRGSLLSSRPFVGFPRLRFLYMLLAGSLLFSAAGCQIIIGVLYMMQGVIPDDSDFRKATAKKYNIEDKSKTVAVLCSSREKAKKEHVAIDMDVMTEVATNLKANGLNVIDSHDILNWISDHGGELRESHMLEISRKFDVDFLIQVELEDFAIRDPSSPGIYRGKADAKVRASGADEVAAKPKNKSDKNKDDWTPPPLRHIYTRPYQCTFPAHQPVPVDHESPVVFTKRFQERVGREIALLFYDHRPVDEF